MKRLKRKHIIIAVLTLIAVIVISIVWNRSPEPEKISYNTFLDAVETGNIEKVFLGQDDQ
jgi:flagellar biosynthesis/type III secretory pathway M-ring protein FliF/YscJ